MTTVKELIFCLGIILYAGQVHTCGNDPMPLNDVENRATTFVGSNQLLSDSTLLAGWYLASADNFVHVIPDGTAPNFAHCGTYNPIYVRDTLPQSMIEGTEYDIVACLVDYDDDCKLTYNIKIRQCGEQYHYYLVPTDGSSAYCFDATNIPVIAPAPDYEIPGPIQISTALMYIEETIMYRPELDFKCVFDADDQYFYEIVWEVDDEIIITSERTELDNIDSTNLKESLLLDNGHVIGINIRCGVRISSTVTGNQTEMQTSDAFFAGINVNPSTLTLGSKGQAVVEFRPTIPLGCRHVKSLPPGVNPPCDVVVRMFDPNDDYICDQPTMATVDLNNQQLCGSKINGWRYNENRDCLHSHAPSCISNSNLPYAEMTVTATNDQLEYPEDQMFVLQTQTSKNAPHDFWEASRLEDVQVNYNGGSTNREWMGKQCRSTNDPRMLTFDGQYWDLLDNGNFVMYRNIDEDNSVQIRTWRCNIGGRYDLYCTCAVAIRSKGDVFIVNVCSSVRTAMFTNCLNEILDVRRISDTSYDVYFPSGTRVRVDTRTWRKTFLNIYIYPTASDVRSVEGLCGNLNGVRDEGASSSSYPTAWKIENENQNMLSASYQPPENSEQIRVCVCPHVLSRQQLRLTEEAECFTAEYATCQAPNIEGERKTCQIRSKRSVHRHKLNTQRIMEIINEVDGHAELIQKRSITTAIMSDTEAYQLCSDYFSSKATYQLADELPNVSVENDLKECMKDVALDDGDTFWTEAHFSTWSTSILSEIGRNGTYRETKGDVVARFRNVTCPLECNGNGNCVNGTCVCYDDFVGDSCFLRKSDPLEITYIDGEGTCDLSHGLDCHECLHVFTSGLLEDFVCNIKTHEVSLEGSATLKHESTDQGEYESLFDGFCCPKAMESRMKRSASVGEFVVRYDISIGNVEDHYGQSRSVYVYDSKCQQYTVLPNGQLIFSLKDNTCFIDGQCFIYGESRNNETCDVCYPPESMVQWTSNCHVPPLPPSTTTEKSKTQGGKGGPINGVLLALIASGVGVLVITCVVAVAVLKCHKKKRNIGASNENLKKMGQYATHDMPVNNRFGAGHPVASHPYPDFGYVKN